jgi:hypothetical protein
MDNHDVLDRLVLELLERETLDQNEVAEIFSDLRKRDYREVWLSSADRPVSDRGPVRSRRELAGENGHGAAGTNGSGGQETSGESIDSATETEG